MRFRLQPSTLAVQLVLVVAGAVAISNIAVAAYFYKDSEANSRVLSEERIIDRTAAVAATVIRVPSQARLVVMRTMGRPGWRFREAKRQYDTSPMTAVEAVLAKRLAATLPDSYPRRNAVIVHLHEPLGNIPEEWRPAGVSAAETDAGVIQTLVPLDAHSMMSGVLLRPAASWPVQIMIAALIAVMTSSVGAALVARRVVRPLSELTNAASKVAVGDTPHVAEQGPDDVRQAAAAFNVMAAKVSRTLESQRHLLSAVGHDLRTPITAMRINLEFIEDDGLREGLRRRIGMPSTPVSIPSGSIIARFIPRTALGRTWRKASSAACAALKSGRIGDYVDGQY